MTFLYRYQDKEGQVREGETDAPSEAEAYSALRKSGIRPMKVWAKPGLINGFSRIGKRGAAIIVLGIVCLSLGVVVYQLNVENSETGRKILSATDPSVAKPMPRQQFELVPVAFKYETEKVLQHFARPGDPAMVPERAGSSVTSEVAFYLTDLEAALKEPIRIAEGDGESTVLLKCVVAGLKEEARMLLASGNDQSAVLGYFMARQKMEVAHRRTVLNSVRENPETLSDVNAELRSMGMKEIEKGEVVR